jgi:hypothetical protein
MRRWLLAGAMLVLPIGAALAVTGTASAASGVSCSGLSGKVNSTSLSATGKLTGCNDTANTGGKGTFKGSETATTGSITWNKTGTTTFGSVAYNPTSTNTCPSTSTETNEAEEYVTGTVTGGTGAAAKSIKKKWTFEAYLCVNENTTTGALTLTLAPGTDWLIGKGL